MFVWPALKYCVLILLVLTMGSALAARLVRPFRLLNAEQREIIRTARELASLKKENAELERIIAYTRTSRGKVQAARKQGYVKPGERILVVPDNVE